LEYRGLIEDAKGVLDTLQHKEIVTRTEEGRWYVIRIKPYRTLENTIEGVVITFYDIHQQKLSEIHIQELVFGIMESVREPLLLMDGELRVLFANRPFYQRFQVKAEETEGRLLYDLGNRQWDIPNLRKLLEKILPHQSILEGYEVEHDFPDIGKRKMRLNARQLVQEDLGLEKILLIIEDLTDPGAIGEEEKGSDE
jgi:two-component system, chemotaxis family, CheB/CheR fusion protein